MTLRFEEMVGRYHDEIFTYVWRLLRTQNSHDGASDAEDVVQDVFFRAYKAFGRLDSDSNHRAWLYKIATNAAYTKLRAARRQRDALLSLDASRRIADTSTDGVARAEDVEARLRRLVGQLPERQRACLTLRYLQHLEYAEIARIMNCSEESARANVYQAIRRLRSLLKGNK